MRRLHRPALPPHSKQYFTKRTAQIQSASDPPEEAHRLWKQGRQTEAVKYAIVELWKMNNHLKTCMYCEHDRALTEKDGQEHAIIDHWEPIAEAPDRAFDWENHVLSCNRCNSLPKAAAFPRVAHYKVSDWK